MKNKLLYVILFVCVSLNAQNSSEKVKTPHKKTNYYVYCYELNGNKNTWVKVLANPSKNKISKIQKQLKFLDYPIKLTGVFDEQTKNALLKFNTSNELGKYSKILENTERFLRKKYKEKKKLQKRK